MLKTEIDRNEPLNPGDRIEMHFKYLGPNWVYLHAAEFAILEWQLRKGYPGWKLLSWDSTTYPDKLVLTFEILQTNPVLITAAVIGGIVISGGLFAWLVLDKVYKITESPAGKVALAGTGALGIAILVFAVLALLRHYSD